MSWWIGKSRAEFAEALALGEGARMAYDGNRPVLGWEQQRDWATPGEWDAFVMFRWMRMSQARRQPKQDK